MGMMCHLVATVASTIVSHDGVPRGWINITDPAHVTPPAVPNDDQDDSAAFRAALHRVLLAGGGTIYVPAGVYLLDATTPDPSDPSGSDDAHVVIGSRDGLRVRGVTIVGDTPSDMSLDPRAATPEGLDPNALNGSVIIAMGGDRHAFKIAAADSANPLSIHFRNLTLTRHAGDEVVRADGIHMSDSGTRTGAFLNDFSIRNCVISNHRRGIVGRWTSPHRFVKPLRFMLDGVALYANTNEGLLLDGFGELTLRNCIVSRNGLSSGSDGVRLESHPVRVHDDDLRVSGSTVRITDCAINANGGAGVRIAGSLVENESGRSPFPAKDIHISSSQFDFNVSWGLVLDTCHNVNISSSSFSWNGRPLYGSPYDGGLLAENSSAVSVGACTFWGNRRGGMTIRNSRGVAVAGVVLRNNNRLTDGNSFFAITIQNSSSISMSAVTFVNDTLGAAEIERQIENHPQRWGIAIDDREMPARPSRAVVLRNIIFDPYTLVPIDTTNAPDWTGVIEYWDGARADFVWKRSPAQDRAGASATFPILEHPGQ